MDVFLAPHLPFISISNYLAISLKYNHINYTVYKIIFTYNLHTRYEFIKFYLKFFHKLLKQSKISLYPFFSCSLSPPALPKPLSLFDSPPSKTPTARFPWVSSCPVPCLDSQPQKSSWVQVTASPLFARKSLKYKKNIQTAISVKH